MLYLNPPFHIINGVSVFADHEDPLQFYYLPLGPRLSEVDDPVIGRKVPQLQLIKYRGAAGNGGFLNFDVDLRVDNLDDLRAEIRRLQRLREEPRLAPVPLVDGTVRLLLLGRSTGDTAPAGTPQFVIKIDHPAKPSLYADNNAAFSVALDAAGVTVLEQALQGELSPIGIVYSLEFLGLRPAYRVRLHIDWDRVQKHLDESFGVDTLVFSSEIESIVDELVESQAIVLEADTFVPEGEEESGVLERRDQALNEARDLITDAFFKPSIDPFRPEEDGWDKAAELGERISQMAVTGGLSGSSLFSYNKLDVTRIDRKKLDVNFAERTTVKRTIYPQRHLAGLFRVLRDGGMDLDRFVVSVDLDDPWFQRRRASVISRANFEEDGLASIHATLRYGGEPRDVLLESSTARAAVEWASRLSGGDTGGAMQREITARYKVTFKNADGGERPLSLESPETAFDGDSFEINPRELYSVVPVPIVALSFPWERYPHVEVLTRYSDPDHGIALDDTFLLDKERPQATWRIFALEPRRQTFDYRLIFRAADHQDLEMPWVTTADERIAIRDPFPQKRTLQIVPSFDWNRVERAFVDVAYDDPANGVHEEQSFDFSAADAAPKTFSVDLADPDARRVSYRITVLFKDGSMTEIPRSFTLERRIVARGDARGHNIVLIRPEAGDFAARKLREMKLAIAYRDGLEGGTALSFEDAFTFRSADDRARFEYDFADPQRTAYEYRITYLFTNGLARETDPQTSEADELVLPLG